MTGVQKRRRALRFLLAGAGLAAVAGPVAAFGLAGRSDGSAEPARKPVSTAKVIRETLRDMRRETGTLGFGAEQTLKNRLDGTITALAAVGSTVSQGQMLYRVDDLPVLLMYGLVPAYRELSVGAKGADVKQLEQNLSQLGYTGGAVDEQYTTQTAAAVKKWQKDTGLPVTGTVDLGRVVFAASKARIGSHLVAAADAAQPGQGVLTLTADARVVTVHLALHLQSLATVGTAVSVNLPGGAETKGKITATAVVVKTPGGDPGGQAQTLLEATVMADVPAAFAAYDKASVTVAFVAAERKDVLSVPVAALLALREGGYGIEVIDGATSQTVAVELGLFAGGRVEVSGPGVAEGMTIGVPS